MRKFQFIFLSVFAILVFGCQQEIDPSIITTPPPPGNGGGGTPGGNTNDSYLPLTAGSWWKYKDSATGNFTNSEAIAQTQTINGILYTGVKSTSTSGLSDTAYQSNAAPNYYFYAEGASPNTGAPFQLLFHFLNDTASVGYNWQYTAGQGNGFTAIDKTTIVERGLTVTIAGKTYNNVIHTKLDASYDLFGMVVNFGYYDFYIAKGVGIIRIRANIGFAGTNITSDADLVDYHIQ